MTEAERKAEQAQRKTAKQADIESRRNQNGTFSDWLMEKAREAASTAASAKTAASDTYRRVARSASSYLSSASLGNNYDEEQDASSAVAFYWDPAQLAKAPPPNVADKILAMREENEQLEEANASDIAAAEKAGVDSGTMVAAGGSGGDAVLAAYEKAIAIRAKKAAEKSAQAAAEQPPAQEERIASPTNSAPPTPAQQIVQQAKEIRRKAAAEAAAAAAQAEGATATEQPQTVAPESPAHPVLQRQARGLDIKAADNSKKTPTKSAGSLAWLSNIGSMIIYPFKLVAQFFKSIIKACLSSNKTKVSPSDMTAKPPLGRDSTALASGSLGSSGPLSRSQSVSQPISANAANSQVRARASSLSIFAAAASPAQNTAAAVDSPNPAAVEPPSAATL